MIDYLRGTVAGQGDSSLVIEVDGVGYLVQVSTRTLAAARGPGETMTVLVDLQVTDDTIRLFGFVDEAERTCFRLLRTVQGVGARVALSLLGALEPVGLARAVAGGDRTALARASGVGARLATRIVTELKDRLDPALASVAPSGAGPSAGPTFGPMSDADGDADLAAALLGLGFARAEAHEAARTARSRATEGASLREMLRDALRMLDRSGRDG